MKSQLLGNRHPNPTHEITQVVNSFGETGGLQMAKAVAMMFTVSVTMMTAAESHACSRH